MHRRTCFKYKEVAMADLSVNIGELKMKNPVMTASGTFGYGEEFEDFIDIARIGGIIVKSPLFTDVKGTLILVWQRLLLA